MSDDAVYLMPIRQELQLLRRLLVLGEAEKWRQAKEYERQETAEKRMREELRK